MAEEEKHEVKVRLSPGFLESIPESFIAGLGMTRQAFNSKCEKAAEEINGKDAQDAMNQFMHRIGIMPGKYGTRGDQQYVEVDGKES